MARVKEDQAILKVYGANTTLDLCLGDGAEELNDHIETLRINSRGSEKIETFENYCARCGRVSSLEDSGRTLL